MSMSVAAAWYAVSLSNGIEAGRSAGTQLYGTEFVIWRDNEGVAHTWEDRCPHRGMRLSFGFVRGNHVACLYHGWQYDVRGQCRFIPAHPDLAVPSAIRVTTYPCREQLGMVWMYADSQAAPVPELPLEARAVTPVRSLYVDCASDVVLQRLGSRAKPVGSPAVTLWSVDADGQPLLAAVQPYSHNKTALHLVTDGHPDQYRGAAQAAAANWAEQIRRELEQDVPAPADTAHASLGAVP
jgi:nitrite reductase/ring-hydroxylating ferredoxin subunit